MADHVRFLHTADWQLGMRAHFLETEAQHRFADARFEAIASVARVTRAHEAEFVVVAGDVFEYSQVDRRTIVRALDGLRAVPAPVFLLAGNHDPLGPGSVYARGDFRTACPDNVHVLQPGEPLRIRPGVEVLGAPWPSKRPGRDLVAEACARLEPVTRGTRVLVAHGAVDALFPASSDPARINLADAERALADGRVSYLALGDRHSLTQVGSSGRIWYAGAPEPTDYDESDAGRVLLVDLSAQACTVSPQSVGSWRFVRHRLELDATQGPATLRAWLDDLPDKRRTLVRLGLTGSLSLRADAELRTVLAEAEDVFAHVGLWPRHTDLALLPDDADLGELGLSGFAGEAVKRLAAEAGGPEPQSALAREALALLHRLVVSAP